MRNATHQEAVAALIANVSLIKLLVRHDPPPKGLQVCIIIVSNYNQLLSHPSTKIYLLTGKKLSKYIFAICQLTHTFVFIM